MLSDGGLHVKSETLRAEGLARGWPGKLPFPRTLRASTPLVTYQFPNKLVGKLQREGSVGMKSIRSR